MGIKESAMMSQEKSALILARLGGTPELPMPARSDVLTAGAAAALDLGAFMAAWLSGDMPQPPWLVLLYTAAMGMFLAWRHHFPLSVYALTLLLHLAFPAVALNYQAPLDPALGATYLTMAQLYTPWVVLLVALTAVATDRPLPWSATAAVVGFGAWTGLTIMNGLRDVPNVFLVQAAIFFSAWLVGIMAGRSGRRIQTLEKSQAEAEAAISREHALIASELHDIVSHAVTVMTLHAAGARRIIKGDPERAAQALTVIEATGTQAMDELRRMLEALRAGITPYPASSSLAGIDMAEPLLESLRGAGFEVEWRVEGTPQMLADSVNHTAYRVVQESLTNVAKHAGAGAHVDVFLHWQPGSLAMGITDDGGPGRRPEQEQQGFGLIGLRERVAIVGGSLVYGPTDSGFQVQVELPLGIAQPDHS
jgi:signal transduction histidine kinase